MIFTQGFPMNTESSLSLKSVKQRIDAADADMSGSTFKGVSLANATFQDVNLSQATIHDANLSGGHVQDVNLSGLRISNANLSGASIVDSLTDGMTINGIAVADLLAAYRAAHPNAG
jgi:uncharacterized protein YjbI with pentapeptide repeats